jgi:ubiquinol oxidase
MDEAENERMHLLTVIEITKPSLFERGLIISAQGVFVPFYSLAYLFNKQTAHRFVGFVEEEAVKSYTAYLKEVDEGRIKNVDAPEMAKKYWNLPQDAKLRDVIIAIRNEQAEHRDVNHRMASQLADKKQDIQTARKEKLKNLWSRLPGCG